jgi:hypothetical protein
MASPSLFQAPTTNLSIASRNASFDEHPSVASHPKRALRGSQSEVHSAAVCFARWLFPVKSFHSYEYF